MIAIDTNVLLRILEEDDLGQLVEARRILLGALEHGERCWISDIVLAETEWVLERRYGASRERIAEVMRQLLKQEFFVFESRDAVRRAIDDFLVVKAEFSDLLIGARARAAGARTTYTFDRALKKSDPFSVLPSSNPA